MKIWFSTSADSKWQTQTYSKFSISPANDTPSSQSTRGNITRRVHSPGMIRYHWYPSESTPRGMIPPRQVNLPGVWNPGNSIAPEYHTYPSESIKKSAKTWFPHISPRYHTPESQFFKPKFWITLRNLNQNRTCFNPLVNRKYFKPLVSGPGRFK